MIHNGVRAYAVSFEKDIVVIAWRMKVHVYNISSGELIYKVNSTRDSIYEINDVCMHEGKLLVSCSSGLWEISEEEYMGVNN